MLIGSVRSFARGLHSFQSVQIHFVEKKIPLSFFLLNRSLTTLKGRVQQIKGDNMPSYGTISSEAYGIWFPEKKYEDTDFFAHLIREGKGPALEVGCGNGRLLVPYLKEGLDVEGVDLSSHMLEECRKRAAIHGVNINLYHQAMQRIDLPHKYSTIYIPYGSFTLVEPMKEVYEALRGFHKHLAPAGRLIIPLFLPDKTDIHQEAAVEGETRLRREGIRPSDGAIIRCYEKVHFDLKNQIERAQYHYDVIKDGQVIATEEEDLSFRWHTQDQFRALLEETGFTDIKSLECYTDKPALPDAPEFCFIGTKA